MTVWTVHYKWFNEKRALSIMISGQILLQKAEDFATKLEDSNSVRCLKYGWVRKGKTFGGKV